MREISLEELRSGRKKQDDYISLSKIYQAEGGLVQVRRRGNKRIYLAERRISKTI